VNASKALAGRIAVVTGGTRGIGLAIARALAEDGASVVVSGRDAARLESAVMELEASGAAAVGLAADQSKREDCDRLVDAAKERFGRIDVLVNNAGITRDQLLVRMKDDDWDQVMDTNLRGVFLMTRAAAKSMMRQKSGRIINITSTAGAMGNAGQVNYSAAKAGVIGLESGRARAGALEHPGQRRGARPDRDGHDGRHIRRGPGGAAPAGAAQADRGGA